MLAAHDLHVRRGGHPILRGVGLSARAGERVAVVGPNGAGKSTLLDVLAGALAPDRGAVSLDGRPLASFRPSALARRRAVLRQRSELIFPLTAAEVVALGRAPYGPPASDPDRVAAALDRVGCRALADRPFTALSGGERQRVDLARVVCQLDAPGLLLLDEPTAAQDLGQQQRVLDLASALAADGHAVLAVLHDLAAAARFADRIVVLHAGHVADHGAPADVLRPSLLRDVFGVRVDVFTRDGRLFVHPLAPENPC